MMNANSVRVFGLGRFREFGRWPLAGMMLVFAVVSSAAQKQNTPESTTGVDAGLVAKAEASSKDVGLPIYPGARPHKGESNQTPATQLGLWGSAFGFKLAVLQLESKDAPGKIAEFYRKALTRYGPVLDCSDPGRASEDKSKKKTSTQLSCEDEKPGEGRQVFKAGTKEKQHIVGIEPHGEGSVFHLAAFSHKR